MFGINAYFLKVQREKHKKEVEDETLFKVFCPGQYGNYPHKLKMYQNGSVHNKIKYEDICSDLFVTNVAFNYIWIVNSTMRTPPPYYLLHGKWIGTRS